MQAILIFLVTFVAAIDQFNFLESLYQPIVVGPVVGAILGETQIGLQVGGIYQLMQIGSMPVGGAQPPNAVLGGVIATIFAATASGSVTPAQAVGMAVPFAMIGQATVTLLFTLMSPLMGLADKAADEANPAGIAKVNYLAMGILGTVFGIVAVLAYTAGSAFGTQISDFFTRYEWIKTGFEVAGGMLRYVGFAILMRIMLSADLWGYYFAGFAAATLLGAAGLGGPALLLVAMIGIAIALADYQYNTRIKAAGGGQQSGGYSDGI